MTRSRFRARVLAALAGLLLAACSSEKTPAPAPGIEVPKASMHAEYVSGIAAAYYCTCEEWPRSWKEMRRFDNYLHESAERGGEAPMARFDWGGIEAVVQTHVDGSLVIRPQAGSESEYIEPFAVPIPDCSRFDRSRFESGCAG